MRIFAVKNICLTYQALGARSSTNPMIASSTSVRWQNFNLSLPNRWSVHFPAPEASLSLSTYCFQHIPPQNEILFPVYNLKYIHPMNPLSSKSGIRFFTLDGIPLWGSHRHRISFSYLRRPNCQDILTFSPSSWFGNTTHFRAVQRSNIPNHLLHMSTRPLYNHEQ